MNMLPVEIQGNIASNLNIQAVLNLRRTAKAQDALVAVDIARRLAEEQYPLLDQTNSNAIAALRDVVESRKTGWMPVAAGEYEFFLAVTKGGVLVRSYNTPKNNSEWGFTRKTTQIRVNTDGKEVIFRNVYHSGGKGRNCTSVAVSEDGRVYSWNQPSWTMGPEWLESLNRMPVMEPMPTLSRVSTVAMGFDHCIAVCDTGCVYSWGNNKHGECGNGDTTGAHVFNPTEVRFGDNQSTVASNKLGVGAAAGLYHSLVVALDGTLWAFGVSNFYGTCLINGIEVTEFSVGTSVFSPKVVPFYEEYDWNYENNDVPTVTKRKHVVIKKVAAGSYHSLAIDNRGFVFGWGLNSNGQVGMAKINRTDYVSEPTRLRALNLPILSVVAGPKNSFAITETGKLYTWGLVNGDDEERATVPYDTDTPVRVEYFLDLNVVAVSIAKDTDQGSTMVVTADGKVYGCPGGAVQTVRVLEDMAELETYHDWVMYDEIVCERKDVLLGA